MISSVSFVVELTFLSGESYSIDVDHQGGGYFLHDLRERIVEDDLDILRKEVEGVGIVKTPVQTLCFFYTHCCDSDHQVNCQLSNEIDIKRWLVEAASVDRPVVGSDDRPIAESDGSVSSVQKPVVRFSVMVKTFPDLNLLSMLTHFLEDDDYFEFIDRVFGRETPFEGPLLDLKGVDHIESSDSYESYTLERAEAALFRESPQFFGSQMHSSSSTDVTNTKRARKISDIETSDASTHGGSSSSGESSEASSSSSSRRSTSPPSTRVLGNSLEANAIDPGVNPGNNPQRPQRMLEIYPPANDAEDGVQYEVINGFRIRVATGNELHANPVRGLFMHDESDEDKLRKRLPTKEDIEVAVFQFVSGVSSRGTSSTSKSAPTSKPVYKTEREDEAGKENVEESAVLLPRNSESKFAFIDSSKPDVEMGVVDSNSADMEVDVSTCKTCEEHGSVHPPKDDDNWSELLRGRYLYTKLCHAMHHHHAASVSKVFAWMLLYLLPYAEKIVDFPTRKNIVIKIDSEYNRMFALLNGGRRDGLGDGLENPFDGRIDDADEIVETSSADSSNGSSNKEFSISRTGGRPMFNRSIPSKTASSGGDSSTSVGDGGDTTAENTSGDNTLATSTTEQTSIIERTSTTEMSGTESESAGTTSSSSRFRRAAAGFPIGLTDDATMPVDGLALPRTDETPMPNRLSIPMCENLLKKTVSPREDEFECTSPLFLMRVNGMLTSLKKGCTDRSPVGALLFFIQNHFAFCRDDLGLEQTEALLTLMLENCLTSADEENLRRIAVGSSSKSAQFLRPKLDQCLIYE